MNRPLSSSQQEGLGQVINLMEGHKLGVGDIRKALAERKKVKKGGTAVSKNELVLRLFTYLGITLIFAGLGIFIHTIWEDIGSLPRVIITFGSGFTAYLCGIAFSLDKRFEKVATPAFILAFLLQPTGLFVFLKEYFGGDDAALGSMIVFGPLALQQIMTFVKFRRPSLLLFSLLYFIGFAGAFTEFFDIDRGLASLMCGLFLFLLTTDMQKREHFKDLTPFFYIVSTLLFFAGLYYFIGRTVFDPIGLSVTLGMLWFSVIRNSKTLYVLSLFYMGGYFCGGPGGGWMHWSFYNELAFVFAGASLALTGHWLRNIPYISLFPLWMFLGACYIFSGTFSIVEETLLETLYPALPALGIYAALVLRSRAVLCASVLALIGFISYFTSKYFADTIGWPVTLIILGFILLGLGAYALKLSQRITKTANPV